MPTKVTISDADWTDVDPDKNPGSCLGVSFHINATLFHLTAFRVTAREQKQEPDEAEAEDYDRWATAACQSSPFETTTIRGSSYVVFGASAED